MSAISDPPSGQGALAQVPMAGEGGDPPALVAYLDNAATTYPKPEPVYAAADAFYRAGGANAGRGQHSPSIRSAELLARTRAKLAVWFGLPVGRSERVIFAPTATIGLNQVLLGGRLGPGDAVYVSPFEHNSVLRPLDHLRHAVGVRVRQLPFDPQTFAFDAARARTAWESEPPSLVVITHASNVCGFRPPIEEIALEARRVNPACVIVMDGAQIGGLYSPPLTDGLVDAYVFSGHKALYGPYGLSGFVLGTDWRPEPILFGATGTQSERLEMPTDGPAAYEAGSQNAWAAAGLEAALDWLASDGRANVAGRAYDAATAVLEGLRALPGVQVVAPPPQSRSFIVAFNVTGLAPETVEKKLSLQGIAVRAGLQCAPWAHDWLGTLASGGTVRASTSCFTSPDDVRALCAAVASLKSHQSSQ